MLNHSFTILQHDATSHWYKCENCITLSETEAHVGEWVTTTPSTCKEYGTASQICTVCNTIIGTRTLTTYAAHTPDENGVCTVCNKTLYEGLTFTLSINNSSYTVSAKDTSITEAYIPATYEGLPVKNITLNAFLNCTSLTCVTICDGVTSISERAFYGCTSLTTVTIPESVTNIGTFAFAGCTSLTSINIPEAITSISNNTFFGCSSLTSITIPSSTTSIGINAFYDCTSLTNITIPNSVKSIGNNAFLGCTSLTSITISDGVTRIGADAFYGCSKLASVTFKNTSGWMAEDISLSSNDLADTSTAATYLTDTYCRYDWKRN